jgi:hypothetical protein
VCSQHQLWPGTPDCPVVHRTVSGASGWPVVNRLLSGKCRGNDYNSPDCPVNQRSPALMVGCAIRGRRVARSNGRLGTPDCPVCTGLFSVHRTMSGAPIDPEDQRSDAPDMEGDRTSDSYNDCSMVHRTVRCTTRQNASLAFQVGLQ